MDAGEETRVVGFETGGANTALGLRIRERSRTTTSQTATLPPEDVLHLVGSTTVSEEDRAALDRTVVLHASPNWERGPGTMLVSDDSDTDTAPPPRASSSQSQGRIIFHQNGHAVSLPASLRHISNRTLSQTLHDEVGLWRRRRDLHRERSYLELRQAAGGPVSDSERRSLSARLREVESQWNNADRHMSEEDCEQLQNAWDAAPAPSTQHTSLAEALEVFRRQRTAINAASSAAAGIFSPNPAEDRLESPDRSPTMPPLIAMGPDERRSDAWPALQAAVHLSSGGELSRHTVGDAGAATESSVDAQSALDVARRQLEEARQALSAAAATRTSSEDFIARQA